MSLFQLITISTKERHDCVQRNAEEWQTVITASRKYSLHSRRQGKSARLTADDAGEAAAFARRAVRDAGMT